MQSRPVTPLSVLATIVLVGCVGSDADPAQQALTSALQRAEEHEAAAASAEDTAALRRETQVYAHDMHGFLDDMIVACDDMMSSMRARRAMDMDELRATAQEARAVVNQHDARMMGLRDLQSMRRESREHRQQMVDVLGRMHATLWRGGMMAGGMMAGGGMM